MIKPVINVDFSECFANRSLDQINELVREILLNNKKLPDTSDVMQFNTSDIYNAIKTAIIEFDESIIQAKNPPGYFYEKQASRLSIENADDYLLYLIKNYCLDAQFKNIIKLDDHAKYNMLLKFIQKYSNSLAIRLRINFEEEVNQKLSDTLKNHSLVYQNAINKIGYEYSSPLHHFYDEALDEDKARLNKAYFSLLEYLQQQALDYILSTLLLEAVLLYDLRFGDELLKPDKVKYKDEKNKSEAKRKAINEKNKKESTSVIPIKKATTSYIDFTESNKHPNVKEVREFRVLDDEEVKDTALNSKNTEHKQRKKLKEMLITYINNVKWSDEDSDLNFGHYSVVHNINAHYKDSTYSKEFPFIYLFGEKNTEILPVHFVPYVTAFSKEISNDLNLYERCETYQTAEGEKDTNACQKFESLIRHYNDFISEAKKITNAIPHKDYRYYVNMILFNDCTHPTFFSSLTNCNIYSDLIGRISFYDLLEQHTKNTTNASLATKHSILESTYYLQLLSLLMVFDVDLNILNEHITEIVSLDCTLEDDKNAVEKLDELNSLYKVILDFFNDILKNTTRIIGQNVDVVSQVNSLCDDDAILTLLPTKYTRAKCNDNIFDVSFNPYFDLNQRLITSYLIHYNAINGRIPHQK